MNTIDDYALSPGQSRIWVRSAGTQPSARFGVLVTGSNNLENLQRAVSHVVGDYEILRTLYQGPATELPRQVISEHKAHWQPVVDFSQQSQKDLKAYLDRSVPLDVASGPILQVQPIVLSGQALLLWFTLPLVAADATTPAVFTHQLAQAYGQTGETAEEEMPFQFIDYCAWCNETLEEERKKGASYWDQIAKEPYGDAALPEATERQDVTGSAFADFPCDEAVLPAGEGRRDFLLAAWQLLLAHLTQHEQVITAVYFNGRDHDILHSLLGPAGRYLPIPSSPAQEVQQVLNAIGFRMAEADEHQGVFFPELMADAEPMRFSFEYHPETRALADDGTSFEMWDQRVFTHPFDLTLICSHGPTGLNLRFRYATTLLDEASIERYAERLSTLLDEMCNRPQARVRDLEIVGARERALLLQKATGPKLQVKQACIHTLFEAQAEAHPNQAALFFEGSECSYAELNRRANRLAHFLRARGVGSETPIAICMDRSLEMVISVFGILKAGGFYLPLDPKDPVGRLSTILADASVALVLADETASRWAENNPGVDVWFWRDQDLAGLTETNPVNRVYAENLAYTIYTSGTTGLPKGVQVAHQCPLNLLAGLKQLVYGDLSERALRVSMNAPLNFDASVQQLVTLTEGHCLYIIPEETRMDGQAIVAYLDRHKIEILDCTPAHLEVMLEAGLIRAENHAPLRVLCAGGAVNERLWDQLAAAPATTSFNIYGPTECTVDATGCPVETPGLLPSIGGPLANYQAFHLNQHLRLTPLHMAGEICLGGDGLARGYLARPGLVAERFVPHPYAETPGQRLYRTGDQARLSPTGRVSFIGRLDDQLKLRGYRIEPAEIEQVLLGHEQVQQTVVVARKIEAFGDEKRLVAYIVSSSTTADLGSLERDLRAYLREQLPEYMVPPHYVVLGKLPLTLSGKIDRANLPEPQPEHEGSEECAQSSGGNAVEELLKGMWCELLGLGKVESHDDFFELGGHSLLTIQLVGRIRHVFKIDIDLLGFFAAKNLAGQAALVEAGMRVGAGIEAPPLVEVDHSVPQLASYTQQRLWFVYQVDGAYDAYHIPSVFKLTGSLDILAMEKTLAELIRRHKTLRTTFSVDNGRVKQNIGPMGAWLLSVLDLSGVAPNQQQAQTEALARREVLTRFDLEKGPLIRIQVLAFSDREHAIMCHMHHIVSDGWSVGVLVQELVALYVAFSKGRPSPLAELPIQYVDYAVWQRQWLQGEALEREIHYWREQLQGAKTILNLPHDHPRPQQPTEQAELKMLNFSPELSSELNDFCNENGITLFMLLLAGFNATMRYFTGEKDIMVGTDTANRGRFETEKLIGCFINQVIMRADMSDNPSLSELLEHTRTTALGAFLHQDISFDSLVEALHPVRSAGVHPFFQVKFVLQNAPTHLLELPGLEFAPIGGEVGTTKLDLQLNMFERDGSISGVLVFKQEVFEMSTMSAFVRHFENTIQRFIGNPDTRVEDLVAHLHEQEQLFQKEQAQARKKSRFNKFKQLTKKDS